MTNMLEGLGMLQVVRHHRVLGWGMRVVGSGTIVVVVFIVIAVLFAHEVLGAFVFVRIAIVLVAANSRIDVARRELVELIVVTEDDDGDVYRAQDRELVSLLE
jgi:hypothetical protein